MNPTRTLLFLVLMGVSVSNSASVSNAAELERLAKFKESRKSASAKERENLRMGTLPGLKNSPSKNPTDRSSAAAKPKTDSPSTTKDHHSSATPPKKFDHLSPTAQAKPVKKQAAHEAPKDTTKPTVAAKPVPSAPADAQVNTQPATRTPSAASAPQPAASKKAVTFSTAPVKSDSPLPTKLEEEPASVDLGKAKKKSLTKKCQEPYDGESVNSSDLSDLTATDTDLPHNSASIGVAEESKEDAGRTEFFWTLLYGSIIVLLSGVAIAVLRMRQIKEKKEQLQVAP